MAASLAVEPATVRAAIPTQEGTMEHADEQNSTTTRARRERRIWRQESHDQSMRNAERRRRIRELVEAARNLAPQIDEQVHKRPYVIVGGAAALGFVAGSLLGSRFGQLVLALGLGYVARNVLGGEIDAASIEAGVGKFTGEGAG
jgi:ElaB/YqjD/DUF883 family membrane-anchored ribosome-binding protein